MYHPAVLPLSMLSVASGDTTSSSSGDEEFDLQQAPPNTKSLILSPFTLTRAFSTALLQTGGGGGGGGELPPLTISSPHLPHPEISNSLGTPSNSTDFTSLLPAEIVVKCLLYLEPQDLCSVSAVCSRWYQLTQCGVLQRRRLDYLEGRREEYQASKENYSPGPLVSSHHQQLQRVPMTKPPCPLGDIQPVSPPPFPSSPTTWDSPVRSHTSSPTFLVAHPSPLGSASHVPPLPPPQSPQPTSPSWKSPANHTPSPTHLLVDNVKSLSLDDHHDIMLCRPLSPDSGGGGTRWVESTLHSLRNAYKEVAGRKKFNKNRLRRL